MVFRQHDFKGKGYLRGEGFRGLVQDLGVELTDEELKKIFKYLDKDKDKKVTLQDLSEFIEEAYF